MNSPTHPITDEAVSHSEASPGGPDTSTADFPTPSSLHGLVSLRSLFSDAAVYGLASVVNSAIGFLLLPLMTAFLSPKDYGILSLFTTSAHLAFVACSLCIHQAFLRHYTEAADESARQSVSNTSIVLALCYWLAIFPILIIFREQIGTLIFGFPAPELICVLAAAMVVETFDALAGNRLQADGQPWALFWIRVGGSLALRTAGVIAILLGAGVWGWVLADTFGRMISAMILVVLAFPKARIRWNAELIRPLASYGAMLVPAILSFYAMTVTDKFAIRFLMDSPLEQVGLYSVGERIAGIMQMANLAFILGWQRFAFRNMHLPEGPQIIGRGLLFFAVGAGFLAMTLAMLGDDLTHWVISSKYAGGIPVIIPLTIAAYFGGLASAAELGLHKGRRPMMISALNVSAAILNLALNCLAIPYWGITGSAVATMISQGARLSIVWLASQREYPIALAYRKLATALGSMIAILAIGQLLAPLDWIYATVGQTLLVVASFLCFWAILMPPKWMRARRRHEPSLP